MLVTGANSGIGKAAVVELARNGFEVWGTARTAEKCALIEQACPEDRPGAVHGVLVDVSDHAAVRSLWPTLPPFDVIVNNAAFSAVGAVEELDPDEAGAALHLNLVTPALLATLALPAMRARGGGTIVMVSSIAARLPFGLPLNAWYQASKAALEALALALRAEVAPTGVHVVVIAPGRFRTNLEPTVARLAATRAAAGGPYAQSYGRLAHLLPRLDPVTPPPRAVARAITRAASSSRPRHRYVVGADALAVTALRPLLANRLFSRLVPRLFAVPTRRVPTRRHPG